MKHIFLNLKRFDVPVALGGVNRIAPLNEWGTYIVKNTQEALKKYDANEVEFVQYFPEAHLLNAVAARCEDSPVQVGCQSVYRMNTAVGGNFGAFTTNRPVSIMKAKGMLLHPLLSQIKEGSVLCITIITTTTKSSC